MDSTGQNTDFGALFEANLAKLQTNFNVGDRIEGVITSIGRSTVFIDVGGRSDGLLDVAQVLDDEGKPTVSVGDTLTAYCLGSDEEGIRLTTKISGQVADAALGDAYEGGIPLEGKVAAERKGGYEVELQNHKAFCPYSQIDIFKREPAAYIGERFAFIISEYSENGRNLVVSRRRLLEKEMEEQKARLRETLAPGDLLTGIVTRVVEFGAFVDIGGTEGLIHVSELSWSRTSDPADVVSEGQSVEIKVLTVDWENNRISLSLKQTQPGPWDRVESGESFRVGMSWQGKITKIMPFGAFVELEPGLEGLIHISKLGGGRRINSPEEVVKEGEEVEVTIENIDVERQRIGLAMDNNYGGYDMTDPSGGMGVDLRPGATVTGIADGIKPFGVFIRFPGDKTGLLHISQIELKGSSNPMRALHDMFPPGKEVEVIVQKMEGTRISLTLASTLAREDD
ncbi:MAG: S1 RNA-binding domain-containing protein, partial [Victivallales bacterium]|nr:S1 RNA-binding domain-containing protein [Victivallales bacterium]